MNCPSPQISHRRRCGIPQPLVPRGWRQLGRPLLALLLGWIWMAAAAVNLPAAEPALARTNAPATTVAETATNAGASTTNAFNVLDDKYHLAIGDEISFQILEDEDPPVQLVVQDSGNIQVPYIGLYPAVGKTCKELADSLKVALEKEYYYHATVVISVIAKPKSRGKIYIVGAVRSPGPLDISSDEQLTVSRAILRAGGFTDFADGKHVRVTRGSETGPGGKQTFTLNVNAILENGKTEDDQPVQPGDLIFVPERLIRF
jgi:protein involved in polysaccharide export with SLBB domain